jgi:DNA-binding transcriptional LysR family regulator
MNLRQLEVFQATMQAGNMTKAGQLLGITQSAVSKIISHAEEQLGYRLFDRQAGALVPTPEAQVLFDESTNVYRQLAVLHQIARNLRREDHGAVKLAAIPSVSHELLPALLQRHAGAYPRVSVEIRTINQDAMPAALLNRSVDFGVGFYELDHPQITSELLVSGPCYLAVGREIWQRYSQARHASLYGFFSKVPFIRLVGDDPMREVLEATIRNLGPDAVFSPIEVQTSRLSVELVRRGMGWTVLDFLSAGQLDPSQVVTMELTDCPHIPLHAFHAKPHPFSQQARRLLDMVPALLNELRASRSLQPARG